MMYGCNNCGCEFNEHMAKYEPHGLDSPPYEKIYVCPHCGVDDFERSDADEEPE